MKFEEKNLWSGGVKKKTLILFQFLRSETNSRVFKHGWEDVLFVSKQKIKKCGRVFFFDTSYFRWRTSFFWLIHLWRPITPVKNVTRPISPTFSESSGRQLSHGRSLDIGFFEQILRNERFMKKTRFFAFFHCRPPKKFKWPPIGQFWRLTPST